MAAILVKSVQGSRIMRKPKSNAVRICIIANQISIIRLQRYKNIYNLQNIACTICVYIFFFVILRRETQVRNIDFAPLSGMWFVFLPFVSVGG